MRANRQFIRIFQGGLVAMIGILVLSSHYCSNRREPFSFVQICDPQLGMGGYEHDFENFARAIDQINELNCDFVLICGDLVHHASDSSFHDFISLKEECNIPVYVVPGNHDVGNIPGDSSLAWYRKMFGRDYYSFRNKGYGFIATNSQLWKHNIGEESERHNRWFGEALKDMKEDQLPVIVFGHYPIYVEDPDEEEEYFNLPVEKRHELLGLFKDHHVVAYLSGHKHETLINDFQGIQLVTGETTSKNFDNRPMGFRYWEVFEDSVRHSFIHLRPDMQETSNLTVKEHAIFSQWDQQDHTSLLK